MVVPESATFSWEEVVDEDGITREYLVADNALIWNRDKKLVNALKSDSFGQSMEIGIDDGYMVYLEVLVLMEHQVHLEVLVIMDL